jgi:hypothetical protein
MMAAMPFAAVVAQDQPPQHQEGGQRQQAPARPAWQQGHPQYTPGPYGHGPVPASVYRGPIGPGAYARPVGRRQLRAFLT